MFRGKFLAAASPLLPGLPRLGRARAVGKHQVRPNHFTKVERIAMVGDNKWEGWMAKVCKPFTAPTVKYFEAGELDAAWA
jgi:hypothetical protein